MASISSLSGSSSSSSIYGNRSYNIISGLASGLDTEELISGLVQSYQQKIQSLQNKNTKYQWQQQAIQSISDKLVEFDRNYASYAYSDTNLFSSSFFKNAVITSTNGTYSKMISASGKSSSEIIINGVSSLASAARYSGKGDIKTDAVGNDPIQDLTKPTTLSGLSGSLTLQYGNSTVSIDFSKDEIFTNDDGSFSASKLEDAINKKLSEQKITTSSGSSAANTLIDVKVAEDGSITFSDKSSGGNSVYLSSASGDLKNAITNYDDIANQSSQDVTLNLNTSQVTKEVSTAESLAGKTITVSLNGQSKTITLPKVEAGANAEETAKNFVSDLQEELTNIFGTYKDASGDEKPLITVDLTQIDNGNALSFKLADGVEGSTLSVSSSDSTVSKILGLTGGVTNYVDTTKTLGDLNIITGDGEEELWINGKKIGSYSKDTELNTILNDINSNTEAGVNVTYSKTTNQFVFTAKDTGSSGRIEIEQGSLGAKLFGATVTTNPDGKKEIIQELKANGSYSDGADAQLNVTINGQNMNLTRSSNSFDLDGMNITLSGKFNENVDSKAEADALDAADKVTFTSKTDADKIVDAVKKMVDDMNAIIKEVKNAYSTMPLEKNDGSKYEPLTDEDKEEMSDSAIETYEEKAKTGILFMDRDLSSLYNDLRNAVTSAGSDSAILKSIGISSSYSDGLTTLTFDEKAFREALESDPDKVQEAFTKSTENGAATDGLMASFKKITDKYAATTGATKGILIEKAGSQYSPSAALDNTLLNQMKEIEDQISKWQDKMSNKVDYYTNKFTQLELLMNQMNSQSSSLAGLMGG